MALRYLTIDFNSFFASVEQQERPELRGKPVGIVPVMAETTGCIAISIEAKQLGLTRNARVADARRLCPGLQIVEARPETYINYHRRLIEVIESCIHVSKVQSIDEVTCELTARFAPRAEAVALARRIKTRIAREVGPCLRSSIGLAPNWLLAKVASDMEKPDGLVILDGADLPAKLLSLAPGDIAGIGPNMQRRKVALSRIDQHPQAGWITHHEKRGEKLRCIRQYLIRTHFLPRTDVLFHDDAVNGTSEVIQRVSFCNRAPAHPQQGLGALLSRLGAGEISRGCLEILLRDRAVFK